MGQLGFYDLDKRLKALSAKGDALEALNALIPFESFRAEIEAVVRLAPEARKSNAGRKPFDAVMMFKVLVLQTLYNLADERDVAPGIEVAAGRSHCGRRKLHGREPSKSRGRKKRNAARARGHQNRE